MVLKKLLVKLIVKLGVWGAGMPSLYGSYEAQVPNTLQNDIMNKRNQ